MNSGCEYCRQKENLQSDIFIECFRIDEEALEWISENHSANHLRKKARSAGRGTLYDLVIRDAFTDQFDMLSVAKLQSAL
jgi:type II secretory ATPase GspE/PulE/Tfp pilus assembly ATPase PilB-like protein